MRNQNPDFPEIPLNVARLTGGDPTSKFLIEVLDKDVGAPKDDYVGLVMVATGDLAVSYWGGSHASLPPVC